MENGGGDDTSMNGGDFRWDIKGSIGVSEGLTAFYHFKRELNTTITNQAGCSTSNYLANTVR